MFELVSRTNHSCDPSARVVWDKDTRRAQLVTMKPIKAGEEVTVAWIVTLQKRKERMEELRVKYKFECTCPWCSLGEEESAKKDEEREVSAKLFLKMLSAGQL